MRRYIFFLSVVSFLLFSCSTSNIKGVYSREYKKCVGAITSTKREKLLIKDDFSFVWTDYKDEYSKYDSSLTYGKVIVNTKENVLTLQDTSANGTYCLLKKGNKLFFYNCIQGKRYRYSNPFIKTAP